MKRGKKRTLRRCQNRNNTCIFDVGEVIVHTVQTVCFNPNNKTMSILHLKFWWYAQKSSKKILCHSKLLRLIKTFSYFGSLFMPKVSFKWTDQEKITSNKISESIIHNKDSFSCQHQRHVHEGGEGRGGQGAMSPSHLPSSELVFVFLHSARVEVDHSTQYQKYCSTLCSQVATISDQT